MADYDYTVDGGPISPVTLVDGDGGYLFDRTAYSLEFNGVDTMIEMADKAAYSYATTSELSIAAWIRPDVLTFPDTEGSGYVHWLSKVDTDANEWVFRMYSADNTENRANRISFYMYSADGLPQGDGVAFQETVVPKQWIHICGTINSSKLMSIYKNGVFKDSAITALTFTDTTTPVRVGSGAQNINPNNRSYFKGGIRDVQIFNRALSASEVARVYNGELLSGIVGRWKVDEGSGTVALDQSSSVNNGVITDPLWKVI